MKKICIIVPIFNALKEVKACVKSILKNFDFTSGEVLLIDDCSSVKTEKFIKSIAKKYPDKIRTYRNQENLGYLQTCNNAVLKTDAEIVVLLNSDCEIPSKFSEKIIKCFETDKNIITASPIASNSASYYIPQILPFKFMNFIINRITPAYPEVFNSEGFCFCVRKSYIDKYGLFDPLYGKGYCEEVDFCLSVKQNGGKCVLIDNLYVKHKRNKSFGKDKLKYLSENNKILYSKWAKSFNLFEINNNFLFNDVINQCFGRFAFLPILIIKIRGQVRSNRILTLGNYFEIRKNNYNCKSVIYTCIAGDSDIIPIIQNYMSPDWEYVCFTDNRTLLKMKHFGMWKIKPLVFDSLDNTRNARWHKTHPHILFPDYDESIWIDSNINILTSYLFDKIKDEKKFLLVPLHFCRNSIYQEFEAVRKLHKDSDNIVDAAYQFLKHNGMPENYGLNETNIVYRKHNDEKIIKLMEDWWDMISNFSKRDQLSFSYVLWKNNLLVKDISIDNARIDVLNFKVYTHNYPDTITGKLLSTVFRK